MENKLKELMRRRQWYLGLKKSNGDQISIQHASVLKNRLYAGRMSNKKIVDILLQLNKVKIENI